MKTVLTKEEIAPMLNPTATAEYVGDIFEFWLGMLDLGTVFNSLLCSLDGGQTLTVASQDWKSRLAIQQFMSTYRHHQHKAEQIQESIHPAGREQHGDYNLERSGNL